MRKKSMAIILVACLLLLPVLSLAPSLGEVFIGVAWYVNSSNRNTNLIMGVAGAITSSGYGVLAGLAGATAVVSGGIGLGVAL